MIDVYTGKNDERASELSSMRWKTLCGTLYFPIRVGCTREEATPKALSAGSWNILRGLSRPKNDYKKDQHDARQKIRKHPPTERICIFCRFRTDPMDSPVGVTRTRADVKVFVFNFDTAIMSC